MSYEDECAAAVRSSLMSVACRLVASDLTSPHSPNALPVEHRSNSDACCTRRPIPPGDMLLDTYVVMRVVATRDAVMLSRCLK